MKSLDLRERVTVEAWTGEGSPTEFTWRGRRHRVRRSRAAPARVGQAIRCQTETGLRCLLAQDPKLGTWRLERVYAAGG
ncbi:MAG: hypothetical protein WD906_09520 [Anaerolineales bacterium]